MDPGGQQTVWKIKPGVKGRKAVGRSYAWGRGGAGGEGVALIHIKSQQYQSVTHFPPWTMGKPGHSTVTTIPACAFVQFSPFSKVE